jgi:hypothetical protein
MANKDKKAAAGGPKPDEQPVLPGDDCENDPLSIMPVSCIDRATALSHSQVVADFTGPCAAKRGRRGGSKR